MVKLSIKFLSNFLIKTTNGTHLKKKTEADPLVVLVDFPVAHIFLALLPAVPYPRVRHLDAHRLLEVALEGVCRMYPAVRVQNVLWDVLGVDTVYGVPDVLARGHNETERYQQDDRDRVMQPEYRRVDMHIVHLN